MRFSGALSLVVATCFMASSCTTLPPLRSDADFDRIEVKHRLTCELYDAIIGLALKQATPEYIKTVGVFNLQNYTAALTLREQSDQASGVVAGGNTQDRGVKYDKYEFGSGTFPGLSASTSASQYNEGKRVVDFKDIVIFIPRNPAVYKSAPSNLRDSCTTAPKSNVSPIDLKGVAKPLDLSSKLLPILDELTRIPTIVEHQEINVDFKVIVDAGGAISIVEPLSTVKIGAGARQTFTETLKIIISRKPVDQLIVVVP